MLKKTLIVAPALLLAFAFTAGEARADKKTERIVGGVLKAVFAPQAPACSAPPPRHPGNHANHGHGHVDRAPVRDHRHVDHGHGHDGPRVSHDRCGKCGTVIRKVWVPGHYDIRTERVCVREGYYTTHWTQPVYRTYRLPCGTLKRVLVSPARQVKKWIPPQYETHNKRVWVDGYWKTETKHVCRGH